MAVAGIICEYNPFHNGHKKQFSLVRKALGSDTAIVCLMSGNYVQRGAPAVFEKMYRAEAALCSGADLVLELPVPICLSSAEGFAFGGVQVLTGICSHLAFGCESATEESLRQTVQGLLHPDFSATLQKTLASGVSFPAAREHALAEMGVNTSLLRAPNDILAVEYCKAITLQASPLIPLPIFRGGSYHAMSPDPQNPSATFVRSRILACSPYEEYIPGSAANFFRAAPVHDLQAGERAVLYRLRTMTEEEFSLLPYGTEGLWRRFLRACRQEASLEAILSTVKTKRYTRSRLDRMILCAVLGLTRDAMRQPPEYIRILGFTNRGREILRTAAPLSFPLRNIGEKINDPYAEAEARWNALYSLFQCDTPGNPYAHCQILYKR